MATSVAAMPRVQTKLKPDNYLKLLLALLPVLLPLGWALLQPLMAVDRLELASAQAVAALSQAASAPLWTTALQLMLFGLPMLLAQLWMATSKPIAAGCTSSDALDGGSLHQALPDSLPGSSRSNAGWLLWAAGMALPLLLLWLWPAYWQQTAASLLLWGQIAGLALMYQLQQLYQRQQRSRQRRWWSLDGVLVLLLLLWVLSWTLLFTSHEPGLAVQPIPLRLDWPRILQQPGLLLWYGWQLSVLALVMFGCYWFNRYLLIRKVLARQGLLSFVLLSLGWILLCYAPLSALLLQLPMNQPVLVPAVPAGNHNPFDWYNFNFMFLQWLLTTPLILAFERQQQDSTLAQVRQLQLQTELQLLQQQINPHFLFNTLNNLYALCLTKAESAPVMVLKLADLLRYVVYQGQQTQVTLQQELDYLQHYLALQQLRQAQPLQLTLQLPADAEHYLLPPLLLIMLLENAFKHGIEPDSKAAVLQIIIKIRQQRLELDMLNSLPATALAATVDGHQSAGMGLANLQRRLRLLFGSNFQLQSAFEPQTGYWRASLQLPLQPVGGELS